MLNPLSISSFAEKSVNDAPTVIPSIREWYGSSGSFVADSNTVLVNVSGSASVEKVSTFFKEMLSLELETVDSSRGGNEIIFTLDESLASSVGGEGYELVAEENAINVKASSDTGLLYGGITVVQCLTADKEFPCGRAVDYPEYEVRSGMLDVGRAWIPLDYVEEITRYMAYFKMNEIHLHINDDGANGYSGFRLESDVKGLSSEDGYYTKDEYRAYQKKMLEYGVTVVTEIDTPFHSSCYSKAENPPPYLEGNNRCLDISKPETLEFVKNLFAEYMTGDDPVFVGKVVHIGTDEYPREYAEQMRKYTDELIDYVNSLGYTPRFWGGLGEAGFPGETPISQNAQMNFWDVNISGLDKVLESDFDVINTVNMILYTVPTTNYGFPDYFDLEYLYSNWQVNMFDMYNRECKMDPDDERLLGACFALWNDLHTEYLGVTKFDIFDRLRGMVCLVSEKSWCGEDTANRDVKDFISRFETLSLRAGDADPGRHSLVDSELLVDFESNVPEYAALYGDIKDGEFLLDGESYLTLTPKAVGFPNTLEFDVTLTEINDSPLFSGDGVEILADADGRGNFGYKTEFYTFVFDYRIPLNERTHICLSSDLKNTYLSVNGEKFYAPKNDLNRNGTKLNTLTIPLAEIGKGTKGSIDNIKVVPYAVDAKSILAKANVAYNAHATVSGLEVNDGRFTAEMAVDGNENTRLSFARDVDTQWLMLDLGKEYDLSVIEIDFFERVPQYEIYASTDGESFEKIYEVSDTTEGMRQTDVIKLENSVKARYIKYVQLKRWYMADWNTYYSGGICEFRAYSFDEARYNAIIKDAEYILTNGDKDNPSFREIRTKSNELSAYLNESVMFTANLEALYAELTNAIDAYNRYDPEESIIDESGESEENKSNKALPIILAAAAAAAVIVVVVAIVKKKKK
ncbi:MAG: family 20 glycosylhydrolase [Clostridia bacterium]|nr:family 20 glycosylhydrolase [Clostridia bacterium]